MKKLFIVFAVAGTAWAGCNNPGKDAAGETAATAEKEVPGNAEEGKIVYQTNCKSCHGDDGTLGISGAKNLKTSLLTEEDAEAIISYGRGGMAPYKELLGAQQVKHVAAYIQTLKK